MKVTACLVKVILVISYVYVATMFMVNKIFIYNSNNNNNNNDGWPRWSV